MTKQQTEDVQVDSQPQQTAEQAPSLTLQDLILVAQIIQLTSERGAYRAEELQNVGALYNKLIAFLDSAGAINKTENATTEKQNA